MPLQQQLNEDTSDYDRLTDTKADGVQTYGGGRVESFQRYPK
jgi:hypothetical protein